MVCTSEDMASLNDRDRKWLSEQIAEKVNKALQESSFVSDKISDAIESFKPNGWKRAGSHIVAFGSPVAICSLIVALLALTCGALYQSFSHVREETEFRTNTKNTLDKLGTNMGSLRALISANQPLKKQNQDAAKELIFEAKTKVIQPIPEPIIEQAGNSFIGVAQDDPNAWKVALDFAAYRSSLNSEELPNVTRKNQTITTALTLLWDGKFLESHPPKSSWLAWFRTIRLQG